MLTKKYFLMKKIMLFLKVAVFAGFIGFTLVSCSSDSLLEEQSVKNEAVIDLEDDEKVPELILFMNESVMQFPSYSQVAETRSLRGFFRWLRDVIKCDAYGYLWGFTRGGGFEGSLVPAVACSIIGAIQLSNDNGLTTNDWILNSQWAVFPTNQDFYKIGSDHNKGIYNMYRSDPQLFSKSNSTIVTSSISSLKGMGYSSSISALEYNVLINSINQSYSSFESFVKNSLINTSYYSVVNILDTYAENVVNLSDNSQIISYTNMILSQIDRMGFSNAKELKAAVSICGNSRLLWKER